MTGGERFLVYILVTALIEGCLIYGFSMVFTIIGDPVRQYLYYVSYNIGYLISFPRGMEYGTIGSGFGALVTGCLGMLAFICTIGEAIAYRRKRSRTNAALLGGAEQK
jgi:hypothetical protein